MAWKTITLLGWWVSFERDSDVYLKHEEVSGFSSIEKIEVVGSETPYKESDFTSVELGRIVTEYPTKYTPGLRRRKSDGCFTIKINAREFDLLCGLSEIWDIEFEYANNLINNIVERFASSHTDRKLEIEE